MTSRRCAPRRALPPLLWPGSGPLKWVHHDSRFATLEDVVNHYNDFFGLGLDASQIADLVEFLKSL